MSDTCKSCGAEIIWAETPQGKRIPVDFHPTDTGNIVLTIGGKGASSVPTAWIRRKDGFPEEVRDRCEAWRRYTSHFATCPHAAKHRRPK